MIKKALLWTLGLALILILLVTPALGPGARTQDAAPAGRDTTERDWVLRTPATTPAGRSEHAMAYDAGRAVIVLFGGYDDYGTLNDTWEYPITAGWTMYIPAVPRAYPPGP
jgi:hypothetical protein